MDGRFIIDYLDGKVPNQKTLLETLEIKGYETNIRILSIKSFGVPVTSLMLILNETLNKIKVFQEKLDERINTKLESIQSSDLPNELVIENETNTIINWDKGESMAIDTSITVSGSTAIGYAEWYYPSTDEFSTSLSDIYGSQNPSVEIGRDYIKVVRSEDENKRQFLIHVFNDIINFFETAYALKDRIKFEQDKFKETFAEIDFPQIPRAINSVCMKRGSIIHDSSINFDISTDNKLKFGDQRIVDYLENGFNSAIQWIDQIYGLMENELKNH